MARDNRVYREEKLIVVQGVVPGDKVEGREPEEYVVTGMIEICRTKFTCLIPIHPMK